MDLLVDRVMSSKSFNSPIAPDSEEAIAREARKLEYDLAEERVKPYIVDMTKELPAIEPLISINGSCVCSRGNISAICGEAKSKKTFLASALVASAMAVPSRLIDNFKNVDKNPSLNVLWVDTEQGEHHVRRVIQRMTMMTGAGVVGAIAEPRLTTLALRELAPHERKARIYDAMRLLPYDIVVIDGIADLQRNTNDLEESDALVSELMALSTLSNTHIICVLHTNPGSDKARGHLGSSLQRKAETVLFVHRAGDSSIVEPQFCRNEPFERFAFSISETGIPQLCALPMATDVRNEVVAIVEDMYGGTIERSTLVNRLIETFNCSDKSAQMRIKRLVDRGLLTTSGNMVSSCSFETSNASNAVTGVLPCVTDVTNVTNVTDAPDVPATDVADAPDVGVPKEERELPPRFQRAIDMFKANGVDVESVSIAPRAHYEEDDDYPF